MIKVLNCNSRNYKKKLINFLEIRRSRKSIDTSKVIKILNDIKKNKLKAVTKYEKRFSKNNKIYASKKEINAVIRKLDPKIKKAIDFAYSRIFKFHSLQRPKDIKYLPKNKIFLLFIDRLIKEEENNKDRVNSIIKFEYVYSSKSKNINQNNMDLTVELISIEPFKKDQNYEITLLFSNNGFITLTSEIIDVVLEDQKNIYD